MSNLVFDFCTHHRVIEEIPPDDPQIMSMNGWDFSAKPKIPYRRTFKTTLNGMQWFMQSSGYIYGPELVTNPGFDDSTGWTLTGFTISNGYLQASLVNNDTATQDTTTTTILGEVYDIEVVVKDATQGKLNFSAGITGNAIAYIPQTPLITGENKFTATVSGVTGVLRVKFINVGASTSNALVQSISVRKRTSTTSLYTPLDPLSYPERNAARLTEFYQLHRLWDSFQIRHEYLGLIRVRFNKPLRIPPAKPDSNGLCEPIEVELIEHSPSYS